MISRRAGRKERTWRYSRNPLCRKELGPFYLQKKVRVEGAMILGAAREPPLSPLPPCGGGFGWGVLRGLALRAPPP